VAEFRGYLDRVSEQTARAGRIVSDLLAFSRRSRPHHAPADLNAIINTTVALVSHKLTLMNVASEQRLASDLPLVPCDASQIQQVVLNLVINGAEAAQAREKGQVSVVTRLNREKAEVVIEVNDNGEGVPVEHLDRIFDPFFSTKEEGKGVGLGLAVVYGIVESHGGRIDVRSVVGQGTTFEVALPLVARSQDAPADATAMKSEA
jgi:two-component system NtrC family sensor kinase